MNNWLCGVVYVCGNIFLELPCSASMFRDNYLVNDYMREV